MRRLLSPSAPLLLLLSALPACGSYNSHYDDTSKVETSSAGGSDTEATAGGVCGDGMIGGGEVCDGPELGDKQCADVDPAYSGALACASDCMSFDATGCTFDPSAAHVVFNEITSQDVLDGAYADKGDAIELFNVGGAAAKLGGWKISDDSTFPVDKTYVFPDGAELAPGGRLVLVEFDKATGEGELPFGISATHEETLSLATAEAVVVDKVVFDGVDAVVSLCRVPDGAGNWQACDQTFGEANKAASTICGDGKRTGDEECDGGDLGGASCTGLGFTGGSLSCSQTCRIDGSTCESDSAVALNELESTMDQIELYNAGDAAVDLSGWILTDDVLTGYDPALDAEKLVFGAGTSIAAGQFIVITKGDLAGQHPFGLSASGETVTLLMPDLTPVSQVSYGADQAALSFCRTPDGPTGIWQADCIPTLGAANQTL